ncbi:MAG TPA: VWA domain-containing protein [Desulfoprunum sp.]|nr:VWA domain-containing protein [Desulfoprunum sp.]
MNHHTTAPSSSGRIDTSSYHAGHQKTRKPFQAAGRSGFEQHVRLVPSWAGKSRTSTTIAQARQSISDILEQLRPEDYFNIIAFGSAYTSYFDCQAKADATNITKVRRLLRSLEADMGGTEMDQALQAVVLLISFGKLTICYHKKVLLSCLTC